MKLKGGTAGYRSARKMLVVGVDLCHVGVITTAQILRTLPPSMLSDFGRLELTASRAT